MPVYNFSVERLRGGVVEARRNNMHLASLRNFNEAGDMLGLGIDEPLLNIDDDETGWLSERAFRRRPRIISNLGLRR